MGGRGCPQQENIFTAPPKGPLLPELALGVLKSDILLIQLPAELQAASLCFLQVQPRLVPLPGDLSHLDPAGMVSTALRNISGTPEKAFFYREQHPYLRHCSLYL